jgi:hypothetical protein
MEGKMSYEETPIGEVTTQAKRDMDLIRESVERKDWKDVMAGVKYQAETFARLLTDLESLNARGVLRS